MKDIVFVVDPFSSGVAYAPEFAKRGIDCVALRSSANISPRIAKSFQPGHFVDGTLFDVEHAVDRFARRRVRAVVAGCEMGVAVAEALADRLGLPGNPPATTSLRRQKDAMQRALADAGLAHIPSTVIEQASDVDALLARIDRGAWVVKPTNSASTDGVMFADGREGVRRALGRCAWNGVNDLGERNRGFVVQPFVEGQEYVIDLVAHAGGITVASVCSYRKEARNGSSFVYAGLDALDPEDPRHAAMTSYAIEAAQAIGLTVGPLHMELLASHDGPVMIEAGARLHGGIGPELFRRCYAPHLLELAVCAYLGETVTTTRVRQLQQGRIAFLANDEPGRFACSSEDFLARAGQLNSYAGHRFFVARGDPLPLTVDLATCPGIVWLAGQDAEQLASDARECRALRLHQTQASA